MTTLWASVPFLALAVAIPLAVRYERRQRREHRVRLLLREWQADILRRMVVNVGPIRVTAADAIDRDRVAFQAQQRYAWAFYIAPPHPLRVIRVD